MGLHPNYSIFSDDMHKKVTSVYPNTQLVENLDYYVNLGKMVFTKHYHLKRGFCCRNVCKHCPYKDEVNISKECSIR